MILHDITSMLVDGQEVNINNIDAIKHIQIGRSIARITLPVLGVSSLALGATIAAIPGDQPAEYISLGIGALLIITGVILISKRTEREYGWDFSIESIGE